MPVPLKKALVYCCQECGWQSQLMRGDVLLSITACRNCGSAALKLQEASLLKQLVSKFLTK